MSSFVSSAITQPFFELQTPDFAWKFIWIVQNTKVQKVQKKVCKSTVWKFIYGLSNQVIKYKSTKSTKVQNSTEIQKRKKAKNAKKIQI